MCCDFDNDLDHVGNRVPRSFQKELNEQEGCTSTVSELSDQIPLPATMMILV